MLSWQVKLPEIRIERDDLRSFLKSSSACGNVVGSSERCSELAQTSERAGRRKKEKVKKCKFFSRGLSQTVYGGRASNAARKFSHKSFRPSQTASSILPSSRLWGFSLSWLVRTSCSETGAGGRAVRPRQLR